MRRILFLICILGLPSALRAQTNQAWANLRGLNAGWKIQIVEMNSKKHSGAFVSFSETAITFQDIAGAQTIPRQNVRKVKLGTNKRRLRNTLIGAAVGVGAGAGLGVGASADASCKSFCFGGNIGKAVFTPMGALVGVLIGALIPTGGWREIYKK